MAKRRKISLKGVRKELKAVHAALRSLHRRASATQRAQINKKIKKVKLISKMIDPLCDGFMPSAFGVKA